jgi:hypothetical protein
MSKLCEHHAEIFLNGGPHILAGVMTVFMQAVRDKPRVSNQICRAIEYLAVSTSTSQNNPLSPFFQGLFQLLIENAYRQDFELT